jgi:phosphoglycolate phosphatase
MTAFFFDLDGTLTDSRAGLFAGFRAGIAAMGGPAPSDAALQDFLGTPLPVMFRSLRPGLTDTEVARATSAFRDTYEGTGILDNTLYPGVEAMLAAVRNAGGVAWVVTSKPQPHAERVVNLLGLGSAIRGIIGAGLAETDTKTELVARALAASGASRHRSVMLGDRLYDVIGARENQVRAIGALWGYGTERELRDAGCTSFARSPMDFAERFVPVPAVAAE